jgi:YesN/AraC family two-component response regulator
MKYRTILCEDNDFVRELLNHILEERGHEIFSYRDASDCPLVSEAKYKCSEVYPCSDIIITDISMPNFNGLEFVANLKNKGCKVENLAIISGYLTKEDNLKALKYDCTVFKKPLTPDMIEKWLEKCEKSIDPERILSDGIYNK